MNFKIGQTCYVVKGYSGFLKALGLNLPIKCKIENYNANTEEYEVGVIDSKPDISWHEVKNGEYVQIEQRHTLIGVKGQNLVGAVR